MPAEFEYHLLAGCSFHRKSRIIIIIIIIIIVVVVVVVVLVFICSTLSS